jgi:mercuric ion binding protein
MNKPLAYATFVVGIVASSSVMAGDRTITLAVKNMDCAACPSIVKGSLEAVPGVAKVAVSFKDKTATVIYDDATSRCEPTDNGDHQGGLSVLTQGLIQCFFNRPLPVRIAPLRKRRPCRPMPVSSSMNAPAAARS